MKLRVAKDRTSGATTLVARVDATDWVDHMNAQWLGTHTTPVLLRARYQLERQSTRVYYNTTEYVALPKYLKHHPLQQDTIASFLGSISQALDVVQQRNIAPGNIVWSPRHVYVSNTSGLPAFAVVPSQVSIIPHKNLPQGLLQYILRAKQLQRLLSAAQLKKLQQLAQVDYLDSNTLRDTLREVFGEPATGSVSTGNAEPGSYSAPQPPSPRASQHSPSIPKHPASTPDARPTVTTPAASDAPEGTILEVLPTDSTVLAQKHQLRETNHPQVTALTVTRMTDRHRVQITASSISIGRSKLADVHAGSNTDVSRIHAFLTVEHGELFLTDNHSTNGTWTIQQTLQAGDRVSLNTGGDFWLGGEQFHVSLDTTPRERK